MLNNLMSRGDFLKRSAFLGAATLGGAALVGCSSEAENTPRFSSLPQQE
jgi:hypothetical protein